MKASLYHQMPVQTIENFVSTQDLSPEPKLYIKLLCDISFTLCDGQLKLNMSQQEILAFHSQLAHLMSLHHC